MTYKEHHHLMYLRFTGQTHECDMTDEELSKQKEALDGMNLPVKK